MNKSRFKNRRVADQNYLWQRVPDAGAENRKARVEKSVLVKGWTSSGMADERSAADTLRDSVVHLNRNGLNVLRTLCASMHNVAARS